MLSKMAQTIGNLGLVAASACVLLSTSVSCNETQCGDGTIERNGKCEQSDTTTTASTCGAGTTLRGDKCEPILPPTKCDPDTTAPDTDPVTGVVTCIGTGGGSCNSALACPTGAPGKMTICGRIFNVDDGSNFAAANPTATMCPAGNGATTGPCALQLNPYNAIDFAGNPSGASPLPASSIYIDDCGRYKIVDITLGPASFVGIGLDDRSGLGPTGLTVTSGAAVPAAMGTAIKDLDLYVVKGTTIASWTASGGFANSILAGGVYLNVFKGASTGTTFASGVTITRGGQMQPLDDYYFGANDAMRTTIDPAANATGVNGTGIMVNSSSLGAHGATGGIPATCAWETKVGASIPGIVLVQTRRPVNATGQTCPL
jgi:hypothetical protein